MDSDYEEFQRQQEEARSLRRLIAWIALVVLVTSLFLVGVIRVDAGYYCQHFNMNGCYDWRPGVNIRF